MISLLFSEYYAFFEDDPESVTKKEVVKLAILRKKHKRKLKIYRIKKD